MFKYHDNDLGLESEGHCTAESEATSSSKDFAKSIEQGLVTPAQQQEIRQPL